MEHLTKSQAASRSILHRSQEDEERRLSKQLKQQKRQRTNKFKEALKFKDFRVEPFAQKGHNTGEDDGRCANGGDSGYMSLEREQIKEFERTERRLIDEAFRSLRLQHRKEKQAFEVRCSEEAAELNRVLREREKQLDLSLDERLKEEESKERLEHARWLQSLVVRKKVLEEELERQKNQQERFFRNVLRGCSSNHRSERRYFETYDRNFEHREQRSFILEVENNTRQFDPLDCPQNLAKAGSHGHLGDQEGLPVPLRLAHNSPLYKSTPDFISYWSGLDDAGSSSSTDEDRRNDGVDSGYGQRLRGRRAGGEKRLSTPFVGFHSDDEMSTCL